MRDDVGRSIAASQMECDVAEVLHTHPSVTWSDALELSATLLAGPIAGHGAARFVSVEDANRVLAEERAAHAGTLAKLAAVQALTDELGAPIVDGPCAGQTPLYGGGDVKYRIHRVLSGEVPLSQSA